ncbi:hypothetical protein DPMN_023168, partial [Dreissena polymorpha]
MLLGIACLALTQVIFYRGYSVEACRSDHDCPPCADYNLHATCVDIHGDHRPPYCDCKQVACRQDSDCNCGSETFQANCHHQSGHQQSVCSSCHPVHCDPSPCLTNTQICVAEQYFGSNHMVTYYSCKDRCSEFCSNGTICMMNYRSGVHECKDPCVPNPCSSGKTCVDKKDNPFYVCEAPHTTSKPTVPPTTTEPSTSRTTHQTTTGAASTSSPVPTQAPPDCSQF